MMKFRMDRISIDQFAILTDNSENIQTFSIEVSFSYAENSHKIAVNFGFTFNREEEKALILKVICEFLINKEDWNKACHDGICTIHASMLQYLASQTVGAARGILFCKCAGTPFEQKIIPPVNIAKLVTDGLEFPVTAQP